jgi:hypothetical protein
VTLASGFDNDNDALPIRALARVLGGTLKVGETVEYALGERRYGYLVPATGAVEAKISEQTRRQSSRHQGAPHPHAW